MVALEDRLYSISEVSTLAGVSPDVLRQWEKRVSELKPKRNRAGRRRYTTANIDIVRRIKYLLRYEKMTMQGVAQRLKKEKHREAEPWTRDEALDLIHRIETEAHEMLAMLESARPTRAD